MMEPALRQFATMLAPWNPRISIDSQLLTRRAALLNLPAPGRMSANGSARLVRAVDGWVVVNLPRPDDWALVPALVEEVGDGWAFIERACAGIPATDLVDRARLLGLALTRLGEAEAWQQPAEKTRPFSGSAPLVIDLSVLWAGPLCGAVLAACGCDVVKVELPHRRDTTAEKSPEFYDDLNGTKRHLNLPDHPQALREGLHNLLCKADILITNARLSSLAAMGIDDASTRHLTWISISAHGPHDPRIGFGDDAAVAGGLVGHDPAGDPLFVGDALADPLTGLAAAVEALHALGAGRRGRIDVALSCVAAWAAAL